MSRAIRKPFGCQAHLTSILVALAVLLVPTLMRAQQRLTAHESTRLTVRLNLQSDAPPRILPVVLQDNGQGFAVPRPLAVQPHPARVAPRVHALDEPVPQPLLDNSPDLLRGPPAPRTPPFSASAVA